MEGLFSALFHCPEREEQMAKETGTARLEAACGPIAEQMGYELVDVSLDKEPTGKYLRFYIDKEEGVSLDDCEAFHRRIQPLMEKIDYDYMEVSSPGADRPLKSAEDFERCQGQMVEVRLYRPIEGAKVHNGYLLGLAEGGVEIQTEAGEKRVFEQKQIAVVRPLIEFDEEDLEDDIDIGGDDLPREE